MTPRGSCCIRLPKALGRLRSLPSCRSFLASEKKVPRSRLSQMRSDIASAPIATPKVMPRWAGEFQPRSSPSCPDSPVGRSGNAGVPGRGSAWVSQAPIGTWPSITMKAAAIISPASSVRTRKER